jgi:hypothetical protein
VTSKLENKPYIRCVLPFAADEHQRDHRQPAAQAALAGGAGSVLVETAGRHGAADSLPRRLLSSTRRPRRAGLRRVGAAPLRRQDLTDLGGRCVARAVAVILDDPAPHIGQIYDLTGPESADLDHYARVFSEALGRPIRYRDVPLPAWSESLRKARFPEHVVSHLSAMAELTRQGRYDRMTDTMRKLAGEAPMNMCDFVKLHAAEFKQRGSAHS